MPRSTIHRFIFRALSLTLLVSLCSSALQKSNVWSQPPEETIDSADVLEIRRLHEAFDALEAKYSALETTYQRIRGVFEETEREFANLRIEHLRQESNAAVDALALMNLAQNAPPPLSFQGRPTTRDQREQVTNNNSFNATVNFLNVDLVMKNEQVSQLSQTEQYTVRRRMEAVRDFQKLRNDVNAWMQEWPLYMHYYWRFADAEGIKTIAENETNLAELKLAKDSNIPSKIATALLELRLELKDDALRTINETIVKNTSLNPIAFAARSLVHACREEKKASKKDMAMAIQAAPQHPLVHWLRAAVAIQHGDKAQARHSLETLANNQDFEIAARRLLSVLASSSGTTSSQNSSLALKNAKNVSALVGAEDWYTELVLAMALNVSNKPEESLEKAQHAKSLAQEEKIELCDEVIAWIEKKDPIAWKFYR